MKTYKASRLNAFTMAESHRLMSAILEKMQPYPNCNVAVRETNLDILGSQEQAREGRDMVTVERDKRVQGLQEDDGTDSGSDTDLEDNFGKKD